MKLGPTTVRALRLLAKAPLYSGEFGAELWRERKGKATSMGGGGDYAAQCFLGRMRKQGLAQTQHTEGSSVWEITPLGREQLLNKGSDR